MSNDYLCENVEGFEHAPDWFIEDHEAKQFELFLVNSGYYNSFNQNIDIAA